MSPVGDELIRRAERGARVREIREALGMTGDELAAELTRRAAAHGLHDRYDNAKISRLENGGRELTADEAVMLAEMDPEKRPIGWLVFGRAKRGAKGVPPEIVRPALPAQAPLDVEAMEAEVDVTTPVADAKSRAAGGSRRRRR